MLWSGMGHAWGNAMQRQAKAGCMHAVSGPAAAPGRHGPSANASFPAGWPPVGRMLPFCLHNDFSTTFLPRVPMVTQRPMLTKVA